MSIYYLSAIIYVYACTAGYWLALLMAQVLIDCIYLVVLYRTQWDNQVSNAHMRISVATHQHEYKPLLQQDTLQLDEFGTDHYNIRLHDYHYNSHNSDTFYKNGNLKP